MFLFVLFGYETCVLLKFISIKVLREYLIMLDEWYLKNA